MRQQSALLAIAVLGAACGYDVAAGPDAGPDADPDPPGVTCEVQSGSRLRRVFREHSDGTRVFLGMHDSELDVACDFYGDGDDLRCMPIPDGTRVVSGSIAYSDVDCSQPMAEMYSAPKEPPVYLTASVETGNCSGRTGLFELGAVRALMPEEPIYLRFDADCVEFTAGESTYYAIEREIERAALVGGTELVVGEGRISMRQIEGEDGSRGCDPYELHDSQLETDCALAYGEDDAIRCLPYATYSMALSTESSCMGDQQVALTGGACGFETDFVSVSATDTCLRRSRVHMLGETIAGALYWDPSGDGTCEEFTLYDGETAHRLGPAMATTSFSAFERIWEPLGGRLERGDLANEDGLRFHRYTMRDTEMQTICSFATAADGEARCLPSGSPGVPVADVQTRYTDMGCTEAVEVAIQWDACDQEAPRFASSYEEDGTSRVYHLGPRAAGPLFEMGESCTAMTDLSNLWMLGSEVAPDQFVSGTEAVE